MENNTEIAKIKSIVIQSYDVRTKERKIVYYVQFMHLALDHLSEINTKMSSTLNLSTSIFTTLMMVFLFCIFLLSLHYYFVTHTRF